MATFWSLFKLTLSNTFGLSAARQTYLVQRKRLWEPALIIFVAGAMITVFEVALYFFAKGFVAVGQQMGQPEIVFTFAFLVASLLVLFYGFIAVLSAFYFSNDLPTLVPLPVTPGAIVLAKFATVVVGEYLLILLAMVPAAITYCQAVGGSFGYWVSVAGVVLLAPIVPLAIASILSMVVMRFINRRHRDILVVLFGLVFSFGLMAVQLVLTRALPDNGSTQYLQELLSGKVSLVTLIGRCYPPAVWATRAITAASLGLRLVSAGAYIGVAAVAVVLMGLVGSRFFYAGLIGGSEIARRRLDARQQAAARAAAQSRLVQTGVLTALFRREWRLFMRMPVYVSSFSIGIVMPVSLGFAYGIIDRNPGAALKLGDTIAASGVAPFIVALAAAGLIAIVVSLNTTSATSISREGPTLWISKVIPVTAEEQVWGKLLFSAVSAVITAAPVVVIVGLLVRITPYYLVWATGLGLLGAALSTCVGLIVDTTRPFLTWTNPQQAVRSLSVNVPMLFMAGVAGCLFLLVMWLDRSLGLGGGAVMAIVAAILALLTIPAYRMALASARRLYSGRGA